MKPLKILNLLLTIASFIYFWVTITEKMGNWLVGMLLALVCCFAFWFVVGLITGAILAVIGRSRSDYSYGPSFGTWSSWRTSKTEQVKAGPAPPPTAASQKSWEERMKGGPILQPPD